MDEACPKCGADDGIAGKCAAMFVANNAEIDSVRAELTAHYELCLAEGKQREELLAKVSAELDRLRAELADESPGTPLGRLNAIGVAAEARGLCTGVEAKPAEVFLIEAFDALRAELDEVKSEGRQEVANIISNYRAAARRDVEEIARLKDIIRRAIAYHDADDHDVVEVWTEDARAALACRPQ